MDSDLLILGAICVGSLAILVVTLKLVVGRSARRIRAALGDAARLLSLRETSEGRLEGQVAGVRVELEGAALKDLKLQRKLAGAIGIGAIGAAASEPGIFIVAHLATPLSPPFLIKHRGMLSGKAKTGDASFDDLCAIEAPEPERVTRMLAEVPETRRVLCGLFRQTKRTLADNLLSTSGHVADQYYVHVTHERVEALIEQLDRATVVTREAAAAARALSAVADVRRSIP